MRRSSLLLVILLLVAGAIRPLQAQSTVSVVPNGSYTAGANAVTVIGGGPASDIAVRVQQDSGREVQALWLFANGQWSFYLPAAPSVGTLTALPPVASIFAILGESSAVTPAPPGAPAATSVSGLYIGSQTWSGAVTVTGDVSILGDLTLAPGTVVRFVVGDDRNEGEEVPADGFNDADPTRLASYGRTHADIGVGGRVIARGTASQPITFTSASATPKLADWQGIAFFGDGSVFEQVIVEWSRNGVTPQGSQPNSVIRNSILRHTMWGCISSGGSGIQMLDNEISDCGHEGIDINGGSAVVRGNVIRDSHAGIVILAGSPTVDGNTITNVGDGIGVQPGATPTIGQNSITLAPPGSPMEWRYGDFAYRIFG